VNVLIATGLVEEVEADIRCDEPVWRETGDGHGTTLIATEAGLDAIGIEPLVAGEIANARRGRMDRAVAISAAATEDRRPAARTGTKQAALIGMLRAPEGATIEEIMTATNWQSHTVRGAMAGALKKRLGLEVTSEKVENRGRVYRIQ